MINVLEPWSSYYLLRVSVIHPTKVFFGEFQLLVTLACFDSTYLFGSILESFRKEFGLATNVHILLFPYLLYPFNQVLIR
jgi:hypothetical protein